MGLVEHDFHIFLSHFLAFALLYTFNTDAFGGALFIMHFRPHSGCFLLTVRPVCCKVICSPVTNNSPTSLQPDHCRSGGSKIPFSYFVSILFSISWIPRKDVLEGDEQAGPRDALPWRGGAFRPAGSRAGLGRAAAGAGGALRAAGAVGRAAVLGGGRGLLYVLCASCHTCRRKRKRKRKEGQEMDGKWRANEHDKWSGWSYERYRNTASVGSFIITAGYKEKIHGFAYNVS